MTKLGAQVLNLIVYQEKYQHILQGHSICRRHKGGQLTLTGKHFSRDRSIAGAAFLPVIMLLLEYCSMSLPNLKGTEKKLNYIKTKIYILLSSLIFFFKWTSKMFIPKIHYFGSEVEKHWSVILFCDVPFFNLIFLSKFSRHQLCSWAPFCSIDKLHFDTFWTVVKNWLNKIISKLFSIQLYVISCYLVQRL